MTVKINYLHADEATLAIARHIARDLTSGVTALTDSSAGTPGATVDKVDTTAFVNVAASGSSLAGKATTEAALGTVKDALVELYAKANAYAAIVGVDAITYSGGGTAADGTVGAVTKSVTGAATGVTASAFADVVDPINAAIYNLAIFVNRIARAQGKETVTVFQDTATNTIAALATDTGTAADPGVTKVAADAALTVLANNVATLATKLNTFNDGVSVASVVVEY